ncbi:GGDEF domain-containing protein [Parvibaculum sp.]|uniref:GGDEF domain-containing protein n=1 Tax=Parvibaculum sp. TaxID=2024848 RepID=UPI002BD75200|nr:GGDEF domain-containing protein [Parvibaculum sp.]HUD50445.1 GGDEF domain-containing protein [Parvibaculum sp.]
MKIGDSRPLGGASSSPARGERGDAAGKPAGAGGRTVTDAVSFMGIPEAELTPKVRDALMSIMAEVERLRREMDQVRRRLKDAEELADRDPLIPVLNRRAFVRELSRVIAYGRRYKEPSGLAYFDIDNFKQVNDTHGHAAGDAALTHLAQLLSEHVRESDVIGRLGGDEFGVILARADEKTAENKARSLAQLIADNPLVVNGTAIPLSISVGAIAFTGDDEPQDALNRADRAMYQAKNKSE